MRDIINQVKKLWQLKTLWLSLFLFKLILVGLLSLPLFITVNSTLSLSDFSHSLLKSWDMSVIVELIAEKGGATFIFFMLFIIGGGIYAILMQFINGGLYYVTVSGNFANFDRQKFFGECGGNFGTHLKISAMMIFVYLLLLPAGMFFINIAGALGGDMIGIPAFIFIGLKMIIMLTILLAASLFSDSMRASAAAFPDKSLKEILKISADYFRPRLLKLLGIFFVTYIPFVVIWILVEFSALKATAFFVGFIGVFLELVLFQVASCARTGQKLWYLTALGRDYRAVNPGRFLPEQTEMNFDKG